MHLDILIEDQSGKAALDILVPKIIDPDHTVRTIAYKGIGRIPHNMRDTKNAADRILLDNLARLLKGYGKTHAGYGRDYPAAVIVVCDLDKKCQKAFRDQLLGILEACMPRPVAAFCIAVEEGEAWLLGDLAAINRAYPSAKATVLNSYKNDSICDTWQTLANAVYPGGATKLSAGGWQAVGKEKSRWASKICPNMDVNENKSPSFHYFRQKLLGMLRT